VPRHDGSPPWRDDPCQGRTLVGLGMSQSQSQSLGQSRGGKANDPASAGAMPEQRPNPAVRQFVGLSIAPEASEPYEVQGLAH
jgi:hypothetical protein